MRGMFGIMIVSGLLCALIGAGQLIVLLVLR